MKAQTKQTRGFTLIELLIVVVIIGILAAIAFPKFTSVRERSYVATVILDLKTFASQQEVYYGDNFTYANDVAAILEMSLSDRIILQVNEADPLGWAAVAWHDAVPARQCGIFYGRASAANASPATTAGVIACVE